ncbi:MAG: 16S rRNA (guanine(527)-N(7))-methyltransferase RsmG [Gammaproteobacteria bacterium]
MNLRDRLHQGLAEIDLSLHETQVDRLLDYLVLLGKWNKSYNLTAIIEPQEMISYHLLDSLAIHDAMTSSCRALDVGSGAGLPGIPMAIAMPEIKWTLLDSNGKKTRFLQQVLAYCHIGNAEVVKSRVEDYHAAEAFDIIVSRAFAPLAGFVESVEHLSRSETCLLTMKSSLGCAEAEGLDSTKYLIEETELHIPGISSKRSLVVVRKR